MATYEYHGLICEADFEEKYRFDQIQEHPPCPICRGRFTVRGMSSFSIFTPGRASRAAETPATPTFSHGADCLCCYPRPTPVRKRPNKKKTQRWIGG